MRQNIRAEGVEISYLRLFFSGRLLTFPPLRIDLFYVIYPESIPSCVARKRDFPVPTEHNLRHKENFNQYLFI